MIITALAVYIVLLAATPTRKLRKGNLEVQAYLGNLAGSIIALAMYLGGTYLQH